MRIGFGAPVSGTWATPENLAGFAARAEQVGYASLWSFQRLLIPEGSGMDPVYQSVLDPMATLAYAAAGTSRIRLGVAVVNLPFVSPAYLAKQATTVDIPRADGSTSASASAGCPRSSRSPGRRWPAGARGPPSTLPCCASCGPMA